MGAPDDSSNLSSSIIAPSVVTITVDGPVVVSLLHSYCSGQHWPSAAGSGRQNSNPSGGVQVTSSHVASVASLVKIGSSVVSNDVATSLMVVASSVSISSPQ